MKKRSIISACMGVLIVFISCSSIEESLSHCIQGVKFRLNWVETNPVEAEGKPVTIVIVHENGKSTTLQSDVHGNDADLNVGRQTIVGYEKAENTGVNTTRQTVSVEASPEGTVTKQPMFFSAGITVVDVQPGANEPVITLPLFKQVRELIIQLKFTGTGSSLVSRAAGNLQGIAVERAMQYGFPPVNPAIIRPPALRVGNTDFSFVRAGETEAVIFGGRRNLLGIDGSGKQILSLSITFSNGQTYTFDEDITALMDGFHTEELDPGGAEKPWYVKLTFEVDSSLQITITDWEDGGESWYEAEQN